MHPVKSDVSCLIKQGTLRKIKCKIKLNYLLDSDCHEENLITRLKEVHVSKWNRMPEANVPITSYALITEHFPGLLKLSQDRM